MVSARLIRPQSDGGPILSSYATNTSVSRPFESTSHPIDPSTEEGRSVWQLPMRAHAAKSRQGGKKAVTESEAVDHEAESSDREHDQKGQNRPGSLVIAQLA